MCVYMCVWPTCCAAVQPTGSVFPEMSALWSNPKLWRPTCMPARRPADPHYATSDGLAVHAVQHSWAWHDERVPLATCNGNDAVIAKRKRNNQVRSETDKRRWEKRLPLGWQPSCSGSSGTCSSLAISLSLFLSLCVCVGRLAALSISCFQHGPLT